MAQVRDIYAGQLGVRFNTGSSGVLFCADPFVTLRTDAVDVNRLSASTINQGGRLSWMYDSFAPTITQGWQAAAFQLAVWDIVSDSGDGFGNGRIQATAATPPGVLNTAITLVTSSQGKSSNSGSFYQPIARCPVLANAVLGLVPAGTRTGLVCPDWRRTERAGHDAAPPLNRFPQFCW
jgi:hypothetical protein